MYLLYQPNVENNQQDTSNQNENGEPEEQLASVQEMTQKLEKKRKNIPFWIDNPNVLFHNKYITEFFPVEGMTYEQKLNAITRTIILLSIIGLIMNQSLRTLIISLITLGAIYMLYYFHKKDKENMKNKKKQQENFENPPVADELFKSNNIAIPNDIFDETDSSNPFGNVLVTDYDYNPNKKPAPPAFNKNINDNILSEAKKLVSEANPDQPDIANKLFNDIGSELMFEQSLRPFTSNPSTTIPNDQAGFAEFCYGSMVSCKEGNQFACARNLVRHTN